MSLFPEEPRPWVVWYRANVKRARWEKIGDYETEKDAWVSTLGTGRRGGDWYVTASGKHPNETKCRG